MKIDKIVARQILDSRGVPTVEADVWAGNMMGRAAVHTGKFVTWEEMQKSNFQYVADIDRLNPQLRPSSRRR